MRRILQSLTIAAVALMFTATSACKKDKKDDKAGNDKTPATKPTENTKKPTPPPAPTGAVPDGPKKELADKFLGMLSSLAAAASSAGEDCDKAAAAMVKVIDSNTDLIAKVKEMDKDKAAKEWFDKHYKGKAEAAFKPMEATMKKCMQNKAFGEAFAKLM